MTIQEGYNGKPIQIKIGGKKYQSAEIWIIQEGLPESCAQYQDTLSYASLAELVSLKREIDNALMIITGLSEE